jgi:hypothetical protein
MTHDHRNARKNGRAKRDKRGVSSSPQGRFPALTHDHHRAPSPSLGMRQSQFAGRRLSRPDHDRAWTICNAVPSRAQQDTVMPFHMIAEAAGHANRVLRVF